MTDPATETPQEPENEVRMSFGEHIEDLRKRLVRSIVFLLLVIVGLMFFYEEMIIFITKPHFQAMAMLDKDPRDVPLLPTGYQTPILSAMKMAFIFGMFLSSPVIGYQMWAFVAAGLYKREKKYVVRFAPISFLLFTTGCCFGYFILIPYALYGLASMSEITIMLPEKKADAAVHESANPPPDGENGKTPPEPAPKQQEPKQEPKPDGEPEAGEQADPAKKELTEDEKERQFQLLSPLYNFKDYLNLVLLLTIILGAIFQLPLIMVFMAKIGVVHPSSYNKWRRTAVIINVCFAALVTPADIFTMLIVAAPMLVLYEIGVIVSYIAVRTPKPADAAA